MTTARVAGHGLQSEGAPHDALGRRLGSYWSMSGEGRGVCACGAMSEVLRTGAERQRWHRAHKQEIIERKESN